MGREKLIDVGVGRVPADLVIRGGRLVNVHTAQIYPADVAIKGDRIAFVGDVGHTIGEKTKIINAKGKYLTPGLIDTHQHSYESQLNMTEYARALLLHGTTTVTEAFYGMGMIAGIEGIRFCLDELKRTPLRVLFLVPVLAYLQNRELGLPATPNAPTPSDLREMLSWPDCYGLEEPPCLPIVEKDPVFMDLFQAAVDKGKVITGHASELRGQELNAYIAAGASSDHESTSPEEALEKTRLGMRISAREGSGASDVSQVIKAITESKVDSRYFTFCGDIVEIPRLVRTGHLDYNIRLAIGSGVNPIAAVQIASVNAAEYLKAERDIGSIVPGKIGDILLVHDLPKFAVCTVIANGKIVVHDGDFIAKLERPQYPSSMYSTVRLKRPVVPRDFAIKSSKKKRKAKVRVIGVTEGSLITEERKVVLRVKDGYVEPDIEQDVLKIVMVDRYDRSEMIGKGFIQGLGIKEGAIGSTYNALYENVVVVGTNDCDMAFAVNEIARKGGGFIAVQEGSVRACLELPLFGLLSDESLEIALAKVEKLHNAVRDLGCSLKSPFHTLSFSCVAGEIGAVKLSHQGLYDVNRRRVIDTVV